MTPEHIAFLYKHKVMYHNFKHSGVIAHLCNADAKTFLEIAKTFDPNYNTSLWCGDCVMNLVDYVYTQADKIKPNPEAGTMAMTFPKQIPDRITDKSVVMKVKNKPHEEIR